MPRASATGPAGRPVVAREHRHGCDPESFDLTNGISRFRSDRIGQCYQPTYVVITANHDNRLTRATPPLDGLMELRGFAGSLLEVSVRPRVTTDPVDLSRGQI